MKRIDSRGLRRKRTTSGRFKSLDHFGLSWISKSGLRLSMSASACWTQLRSCGRRSTNAGRFAVRKDGPDERYSKLALSGNDHLRAEERFASAWQEASKADIRSTNGQCVGGAEIWPQPMSMADIDLQSYVFWHTACTSRGEYSGSPRAKFLRGS